MLFSRYGHARYGFQMTDRFLYWGDPGNQKAAESKLAASPPLVRVYIYITSPGMVNFSVDLKGTRIQTPSYAPNLVVALWPFSKGSSKIKEEYFFLF